MATQQGQVQKVISSCSIPVHEAKTILTNFLKEQKIFSEHVTSAYEKNDDDENEVLGFGQEEEDELGKTEEIERRLKGILDSISGNGSRKRLDQESVALSRGITSPSHSDSISSIKQEDLSEAVQSKKERKALEKEKIKAEAKEKKRAEKEAKKAAKAKEKAEKKAAKAEKKAAKKRKHSDVSS